ncbi:MAG: SDR family oxidoreductase [Caulobacterales bacterium]
MAARRVVLIDRPSGYVGPALARRLARSGHDLALVSPSNAQVAELRELGARVEAIALPDTGADSLVGERGYSLLVKAAIDTFGHIDSAALFPGSPGVGVVRGPLLQAKASEMGGVTGYFQTTLNALQAIIPAMKKRGGQIVFFTSDSGSRPEAGWALYGAARAGQTFLVRAAALEHARDNVLINAIGSKNAVFPGFPGIPDGAATDSHVNSGPWAAPLEAETPIGRLGTMEELASFASVLLDGSNRFQTAQFFSFSGGWSER